jgi:hypothetical protein
MRRRIEPALEDAVERIEARNYYVGAAARIIRTLDVFDKRVRRRSS